jgi:hypothetical protein
LTAITRSQSSSVVSARFGLPGSRLPGSVLRLG